MIDARTGITRRVAAPVFAVLVAAGALLWHHLPVPTQIFAPFDVRGSLGSPVRGHSLTVTATGVTLAPKGKFALSEYSTRTVSAIGLWLVVDGRYRPTRHQSSRRPLMVGGNTYQVSLRSPARGFGIHVDPGLPQHGYWAFEVAPELFQPPITRPCNCGCGRTATNGSTAVW